MTNSNIYVLIEFILLVWQFKKWNNWNRLTPISIIGIGMAVWMIDHFYLHSLKEDTSAFRMAYSFAVLILSMRQIAKIVVSGTRSNGKKPELIFCIGFILYFIFKTYYESFNLIYTGVSTAFFTLLWLTMTIINFITNLIYTYAIIWIRKKIPFTLPY